MPTQGRASRRIDARIPPFHVSRDGNLTTRDYVVRTATELRLQDSTPRDQQIDPNERKSISWSVKGRKSNESHPSVEANRPGKESNSSPASGRHVLVEKWGERLLSCSCFMRPCRCGCDIFLWTVAMPPPPSLPLNL